MYDGHAQSAAATMRVRVHCSIRLVPRLDRPPRHTEAERARPLPHPTLVLRRVRGPMLRVVLLAVRDVPAIPPSRRA